MEPEHGGPGAVGELEECTISPFLTKVLQPGDDLELLGPIGATSSGTSATTALLLAADIIITPVPDSSRQMTAG